MFTTDSPKALSKRFRRATRLKLLSFKALAERKLTDTEFFEFRCNVCGNITQSPLSAVKHREMLSCYSCGSNKRFRSVIAALSSEFYGKVIPLPDFEKSKEITGFGLSDADVYARGLSNAFSYTNTYYHQEPRLDITSIPKDFESTADFFISSDVFEHLLPPASIGFDNVYRILKTDGVFIFSVPYKNSGATIEHYPELFEHKIVSENGKHILINKTRQGELQRFEDLRFHGGPGSTLEMRLYSIDSILSDIEKAGFTEARIWKDSIPEFGILQEADGSSFVISMRKRESAHLV